MSSQSALDTAAALQTLGAAAFEWKIDGARVQIHKAGNEVRVYTRNLNDVTQRVPEIVALVRPASERFRLLAGSVPPDSLIPRIVTGDPAEATEFFEQAIVHGHEGVMAKSESLDAPCEAGRRGAGRIKIKRANTLDLVVLAAEWGHGRRRGWLSNLHLGARDQNGGYVMLGKTFKGLTNQMLEWQAQEFLKRETVRDAAAVHLRPEVVVEVAFNEVQASSRYPGGLALRFARVKGYRPDKRRDEADTIETVRQLYSAQVHAGGPQDPAARS